METHTFSTDFARRIPNPGFPGSERHILLMKVEDLPAGLSKAPNPREQRVDRAIWRDIEKHLLQEDGTPGTFHLKNKGITILAHSVTRKADDSIAVHFQEGLDGIVDGGHTYDLIIKNQEAIREKLSEHWTPQHVKVEVLTGIDRSLATEIAGGLNTAIQVQRMSLENLKGQFEWIKDELRGEPYASLIAYRENEKAAFDARDIVAVLDLFNIHEFPNDGNEYPVRAYAGKAEVLDAYIKNRWQYESLRPILRDILTLHDVISSGAHALHNKRGGRAGKLSFVDQRKTGDYVFPFLDAKAKYRLSRAALYPMLSAFRWMVELDPTSGVCRWRGNFDDVLALWENVGGELMRATQATNDEYGRKANAIGRSRNHWATLHGTVVKSHLMSRQ